MPVGSSSSLSQGFQVGGYWLRTGLVA